MSERIYLKNSIRLGSESDGVPFQRTFMILDVIDEGASVISYEAFHGKSGRGVLKEFYPQNDYAAERDENGQLVHPAEFGDAKARFLQGEKDYAAPYDALLRIKQKSTDGVLAAFIPAFEIYYGCDAAGNKIGTTYIWTPEPQLLTFDKVCDDIHAHPEENPEHKLVTVLHAIRSLAECVRALHSCGLVHADIKPSNFGFVKRKNEVLTETLSLFDVNSIRSVYDKSKETLSSEGYAEPEAGIAAPDNQTDIFSIGATLFTAIIVTGETRADGFLYRPAYYPRLRQMVDASELIQASEANSHPRLRNVLTVILEKCLCERADRYENCEELIAALNEALYYAVPSDIGRGMKNGQKWVLADVEKSLDKNKEKNSFLAIQYHLYRHPVWRCLEKEAAEIRVLVIGFGNYGQKFLDACLENCQMPGKTLCVTVLSEDKKDREVYLAERPELSRFFNIDGSLRGRDAEEIYGNISFRTEKLAYGKDASFAAVRNLCGGQEKPDYIFIALGDDALNLAAAKAEKEVLDAAGEKCEISFVCENRRYAREGAGHFHPLNVNEKMEEAPIHAEIERMALNTHLLWEKDWNVDFAKIKANFKKRYNHDSCVSMVLSIKYKLYSIGIDLDETGFDEAAAEYAALISDKRMCGLRNALIAAEHRRWVTEKLCLGWRTLSNLEKCAGGMTKDARRKEHVCIVRSRPDMKLSELSKNGRKDLWDTATEKELAVLDELDRMSVMLHRVYARRAETVRRQNPLSGHSMTAIESLIEGERRAGAAFQEWYVCLKDILNKDTERAKMYSGLRDSFLDAADSLSEEKKKYLMEQVKAFDTLFYPIRASVAYRDYKQEDVKIVDSIPFVLTYSEHACLAVPFRTGSPSDVFDNIAAAAVVNPENVLFLYLIENRRDAESLKEAASCIAGYMRKKHMRCRPEYILLHAAGLETVVNQEFENEILALEDGSIRRVRRISYDDESEIAEKLKAYLSRRSGKKKFFAAEKNASRLSGILSGAGFYPAFASYKFDAAAMKFYDISGCGGLLYIPNRPHFTIADMTAFRLSFSENINQPEFFATYKDLWKEYDKNTGTWKLLCDVLGKYSERADVLTVFPKKALSLRSAQAEQYEYILPASCGRSAEKIITFLKENDILEQESEVLGDTSDSCRAVIFDRCGNQSRFAGLFRRVNDLKQPENISVHMDVKQHEAVVRFDNLEVKGLSIAGSRQPDLLDLLHFFEKMKCLIGLESAPDGTVRFTYASRKDKQLLTEAGRMLEVYTWHKVKELGAFDDAVSGYEISWEGSDVKSELDLILTRGFRSLFVECKARADIQQDFYFKLYALCRKFGIHATAVLIADTREKAYYDTAALNAMQRERGKMLDVVTIWKPDEIRNIGHTLLKVMNGKYVSSIR